MSPAITWQDISLRLALTAVAGAVVGLNRGEHGRPAGLRTIMLVTFASSVAMILANTMIATHGKSADSFVQLDMMRLPLGILTGIGFIGAGAILRRGDFIVGVTTAATIWFMTMVGLCIGAGQIGLGLSACAIGFAVLAGLKPVEDQMRVERRAHVSLTVSGDSPSQQEIREFLCAAGMQIISWSARYSAGGTTRRWIALVITRSRPDQTEVPEVLEKLSRTAGVKAVRWDP